MTELAVIMVADSTTLSRTMRPLEREGLIRIETGKDRRERVAQLTEKGRRAVKKVLPSWKKIQSRMVERLGEARYKRLLSDLMEVISAAQAG